MLFKIYTIFILQQRPTPAHLTSAQAETILAVACQRESDNARRMRLGLEPVAQPYPYSVTPTSAANVFQQPVGTLLLNQNGSGGAKLQMSSTSSDEDVGVGDSSFDKSSSNAIEADTDHRNGNNETENRDGHDGREGSISTGSATAGDLTSINDNTTEDSNAVIAASGTNVTSSSPNNNGKTVTINIYCLTNYYDYIHFGILCYSSISIINSCFNFLIFNINKLFCKKMWYFTQNL